ncbi:hypothetical protein [Yeosuana sp.]|uniref:hypothetical protein n=1 Tax=Yeosuana sp. TaxID=2529388 RepID=UPI0040551720
MVLVVLTVQIFLAFQGFDMCDEGFSLTFYQQFFNAPESVEYNFVYWLSGLVGGIWYLFYNEGGILWFRLLAIIVNSSTFILSYKLLKNHIKKNHALIGLSMVLFVNHFGFLAFYHNQLSALIAVFAASVLIRGISKNNLILIGLAGSLIGINIFSRLPNVTLLVWLLVIPFSGFLNSDKLKKVLKSMLVFAFGVVSGVFFILVIMYFIGHLGIMERASLSIINLGGTDGSTHNIISLFKTYWFNYKKVFTSFSWLVAISLVILIIENLFKNKTFLKRVLYLIPFLGLFILFRKGGIQIMYAIGFIGTLWVLFSKQEKHSTKILALLGLLMMLFLPLGSAGGMYDSGYMWIWLSVPFFIHFLSEIKNTTFIIKTKGNYISRDLSALMVENLMLTIVLSYFVSKAYSISQEAYFDKGSRVEKTYTINCKYARAVYTTKERATITNELLRNLQRYINPDDYLLAYDCIPMIHFLTNTKPYMYNPWVWVYDGNSFEEKIEKAEREIPILPIVVQQKFSTIGAFSIPLTDYMDETKEETYLYNSRRVLAMNSFLKRNKYYLVWSNQYFNIYKSNKKIKF